MIEAVGTTEPVKLSTRTLRFADPQNATPSSDVIVVTNQTDAGLAFKVKTNNQARYIVRPNVGLIPKSSSVEIRVALQAPEVLPAGPSKDKFLLRVAPADHAQASDFWAARDNDPTVFELKVRVQFVLPNQQALDPSLTMPGRAEEAVARVKELQHILDNKNLELANLRAELAETRAETERVLAEAPNTPLAANKAVADPFGGVSIASLGLMLLLFLVLVNVILRFFYR